ncbi:hypothetical protein SSX86_010761 [Deinandra increscens subsp. villosa]|uniref:HTH myb-type domain-containing protein n=1 Tax=Deinandra increscens subsp. villosa TaxID=3103831 RepID=A0AAP0DFW0_9ASTR
MSPHGEEILECFENQDEFFLTRPASLEDIRNASYYAYQSNLKSFGEDEEMKASSKSSLAVRRVGKKTKVIWTKDLHNKFLEAIGKLGIDNAVPKKIIELMKVEGLTRDHVASHLQKYRMLSKKIAQANYYDVQTASKSSILESSMTNGASWNNSSLYSGMHAVSPLILDTSSSYFPVLEASSFNSTNKGDSMQAMTKNLDEQRTIIDDTTSLGVVNFGEFYVQNSSNSSFGQNPNGFESDYSSWSEFLETNSLYGADSNINLQNVLGEDDLMLSEVDIAYLLSFANDSNLPVNLDHTNQDVINGPNFPNNVSFYSNYLNHNEELTSVNQYQTFDGYLPGFDPTFKCMDERFIEPVWCPESFGDEMTLQGQILNSYLQA